MDLHKEVHVVQYSNEIISAIDKTMRSEKAWSLHMHTMPLYGYEEGSVGETIKTRLGRLVLQPEYVGISSLCWESEVSV